jgi:UDP-glucose 4-epimerase
MNVLVTGGCGFLGKYVMKALPQAVSFDNLDPLCGGTGVADIFGDVSSLDTLKSVIREYGITHIVHLAAYGRNLTCQNFPESAWRTNVTGTFNVLEAARQLDVKRVVCASSNITLSDQPTVYKTTKKACEDLVSLYATMGVSCMALRPSNIYGKGQSKSEYQPCAFAGLDKSYAEKGYFTITGDGTQSRDWTHAQDVARAFVLALFSDISGVSYDVCTGSLTSMNTIAGILDVDVKYVPARPGDAKELVSDPGPATDIGFLAQIKLQNGIWDAFPEVKKR